MMSRISSSQENTVHGAENMMIREVSVHNLTAPYLYSSRALKVVVVNASILPAHKVCLALFGSRLDYAYDLLYLTIHT
jgi:hypothetical protein